MPPLPSNGAQMAGRKIEFLGSIMSERTLQMPNSRSLTSAFTWALEKLLSEKPEGFDVFDIYTKLMCAQDFSLSRTIPLSGDPRLAINPRPLKASFSTAALHPAIMPGGAFMVGVILSMVVARVISPSTAQLAETLDTNIQQEGAMICESYRCETLDVTNPTHLRLLEQATSASWDPGTLQIGGAAHLVWIPSRLGKSDT